MLDIVMHSIARAGGVEAPALRWVDHGVRRERSGPALIAAAVNGTLRVIGQVLVAVGRRLEVAGARRALPGRSACPAG